MNTEVEELRERMQHATDGIAVPGGLARRAARHRRSRILTRATAAAATAAVVTGAAVAATTAAAPRDGGTITGARLVSNIRSALNAASAGGDMVQLRNRNGAGEQWYYQSPREVLTRQETFSASGQPVYDQGSRMKAASYVYTFVSYPAKTWSRSVAKVGPQQSPAPQVSCETPIGLSFMQNPATLTADIREALSCGQLTNKGTADIDGIETIKLVSVLDRRVPGGRFVRITTLCVNPTTYLPVRWQASLSLPQPDGHAARKAVSYDVSWLPPTSANLADFRVPIPAGFTLVSHR